MTIKQKQLIKQLKQENKLLKNQLKDYYEHIDIIAENEDLEN